MDRCFDSVVVGAGVAGLRAAIALADEGAHVAVLTKDVPERSSSGQARGGIAVALSGQEEELVLHEEDTLAAGAGLGDGPAVRALVRDGHEEVWKLIEWGARFDREGDRYHLTREAAHSLPRILHAGGDATGREIVRTLVAQIRARRTVTRVKAATCTDLLVSDGRCVGVRALLPEGETVTLGGRGVLLATGGIGRCWRVTSNPEEATGDGLALALRAGCALGDMEFVQFHPTALAVEGAPPWLLTEALRGEGGVVLNEKGERFLLGRDPRGELAPRDVVARGIAVEMRGQGGRPVRLDLRPIGRERLERRFPGVLAMCLEQSIDPMRTPIPIRPAAHYAMGGVVTDLAGKTAVPGLFAAGEVACTGVHGANRLASNSLLEGLVFGARAATALLDEPAAVPGAGTAPIEAGIWGAPERTAELRDLAESSLRIVRSEEPMRLALEDLDELLEQWRDGTGSRGRDRLAFEAASTLLTLRAVARAGLWRRESRGAHYREDHPEPRPEQAEVRSRVDLSGRVWSVPTDRQLSC